MLYDVGEGDMFGRPQCVYGEEIANVAGLPSVFTRITVFLKIPGDEVIHQISLSFLFDFWSNVRSARVLSCVNIVNNICIENFGCLVS